MREKFFVRIGKFVMLLVAVAFFAGCTNTPMETGTGGTGATTPAPKDPVSKPPVPETPAFNPTTKRKPATVTFAKIEAPAMEQAVPANLDLPANFKAKGGKAQYLGFRRTNGIVLPPQQGTHLIYVSETRKGMVPNDMLQVGDIIFAVNGKPLKKDATKQFRNALGMSKKDLGIMWFMRWRKGKATRCVMDLGTQPLDLTQTGTPGATHDWRLGPLGANGWGYHKRAGHGASSLARQLIITAVDKEGPSTGKLKVGDVIVGVGGVKFKQDVRRTLANAINEAEKAENDGALKLMVYRPIDLAKPAVGKEIEITLLLPVLGTYSNTAPFNCPKTDKIIDNAVAHMKRNEETLLKPGGWINYINGLGLLATGREDVMPMVTKLAHGSILKPGEKLSVENHVSMMCWWWSYKTVFLAEYYLRTKDPKVFPTLEEHAVKISMGQSGAGTWGHTYAAKANTGYLHGHLGGYGAINQQGLTCMIGLALADKAGVKNQELTDAIKRGTDFFAFFIGKGTIPYGDHGAANGWFDDNGKSGQAAIYFDLLKKRKGAQFFSEMILGSAPNGRETGHTGHFWSHLWGGIGVARGGDFGLQVFMKEMDHVFTLERQPEGRFAFQENIGEAAGGKAGPKTKWDCTGARLLQLCVPRRAIYICGKETPKETHLTQNRVDRILWSGWVAMNAKARASLTVPEILDLLRDPLPPVRAMGAQALAEQGLNIVDKLMPLLESDNKYARYGAAEALCKAGFGNKQAADRLISMMATDKDVTFQTYAIAALINRDKEKGLLTVAKPAIPVLLKMATRHSEDDPRRVLQHDIGRALFYNGRAQPRRGLLPEYGLDEEYRPLLIPAIKEILTNENGWARSTMSGWIYDKLTPAEREQLWGDVYVSSRYIAPSGIMFASGNRTHGLKLMAKNHIEEGLHLAVWYIRYQKGHGGPGRVPAALEAIEMYGSHAKKIIPDLEAHLPYWIGRRNKRRKDIPPNDPALLIEKTIAKIKAMPPAKFQLVSIADQIKKTETDLVKAGKVRVSELPPPKR